MFPFIIYFCIFIAGILLFEAVVVSALSGRQRSRRVNQRLSLLQDLPDGSSPLDILTRARGINENGAGHFMARLRLFWTRSGMTMKPLHFIGITTAVSAGIAMGMAPFVGGVTSSVVTFAVAAAGLPLAVLARLKKKRIAGLTRQLPNALDIIVRSLYAGHPVARAIDLVAKEMPDPVGSEFGIVSDELTYGLSIDEAMAHLYERVGADDLRLLATTVSVQRSTGGNLGEILFNLSAVIRERFQMRGRIRALSAEGRVTAWLMAAFPFIMYFALSFIVPNYFEPFWQSPFVTPVLVGCGLLMVIGNYILFRMVNFDF